MFGGIKIITATVDPPSIPAGSTVGISVDFTDPNRALRGIGIGDAVIAIPPATLNPGILCITCYAVGLYGSPAQSFALSLHNHTAGAINDTERTWTFVVIGGVGGLGSVGDDYFRAGLGVKH